MKSNMSLMLYFNLMLTFFYFVSCNTYQESREKKSELIDTASILRSYKDSLFDARKVIFKYWMADSLKKMNITKIANPMFYNGKILTVNKDSSLLTVVESIHLIAKSKKMNHSGPYSRQMLELLKSYNENPGDNFELKFNVVDKYSVSPAEQLQYDLVHHFDSIIITKANASQLDTFMYVYDKGSLVEKIHIARKNKDMTIKQYALVWRDRKILKIKTN